MQMVGAGGVDNNAVRRIGGDDRARSAAAPRAPTARARRRRPAGSASWISKTGDQRLGLGCRHADAKARGRSAAAIGGRHHPPLPSRPTRTSGTSGGGALRPASAAAGRSARSAGRARRPVASHASNSKSALSPARQRISSTSQRARPMPGTGKRRRRQHRDAPARHRGGRLPEIRRLGLPPPAAQRDADGPGTFGGELQPPRGGHGQAGHFGDHCTEPAMPQALLASRRAPSCRRQPRHR